MTEEKKVKKNLFYLGIIIFTVGVIATAMGYNVGSPFSPYANGSSTYVFPFFNWITLAGIIIAVVGYYFERKAKQ